MKSLIKNQLLEACLRSKFLWLPGLWLISLSAAADMTARIHIATDYIYRGVLQTHQGLAYQGSLEYQFEPGLFVGAWASRVDYGRYDQRDTEIDYFAGYQMRLSNNLAFEASIIRHSYSGSHRGTDYDWDEVLLSAYLHDRWTLSWGLADNWLARKHASRILELTYLHPLPAEIVLDTTLGYQYAKNLFGRDFAYMEIGLNRSFEHLSLRLAHSATESDAGNVFGDKADNRWLASVAWAF